MIDEHRPTISGMITCNATMHHPKGGFAMATDEFKLDRQQQNPTSGEVIVDGELAQRIGIRAGSRADYKTFPKPTWELCCGPQGQWVACILNTVVMYYRAIDEHTNLLIAKQTIVYDVQTNNVILQDGGDLIVENYANAGVLDQWNAGTLGASCSQQHIFRMRSFNPDWFPLVNSCRLIVQASTWRTCQHP
jgi:hypothetical protein